MKQIIRKFGILSLLFLFLLFSVNFVDVFAKFDTYSFPQSFIDENGSFTSQIVVGSDAEKDLILANRIIDGINSTLHLPSEDLVEITYKVDNFNFEDKVNVVRKSQDLNYGETLELVSYETGITEDETDFLIDDEFESELSDRDYEQKLRFFNGEFNYALRDDVEGVEDITDGIYYDDHDVFAVYSIEFDRPLDLSRSDDLGEDLIGSSLNIMGFDFIVVSARRDGSDLDELELVGGSQRVILIEGETSTFEFDGVNYDVIVNIVTEDEVSFIINDEIISLDIYETYDIEDNFSITVVELVDSNRDAVMGHVELILGGQKLLLGDGREVEINEEKVKDLFEKYSVESDFSDGQEGMNVIEIIYSVEEEVLLEEGDVLLDVLFNVFELRYEGRISFESSIFELSVNDEVISVGGVLFNGESLNLDLIYTNTSDGVDGVTYLRGERDENRIFMEGSDIDLFLPVGISKVSANEILINFTNNDIDDNGFLMSSDIDKQYLYEITNVDSSEGLVDIKEIFNGEDDDDLETTDFISEVRVDLINAIGNDISKTLQLDLNDFNSPIIAFENDLIMDLSQVESVGVNGLIRFYLDEDDVKGDVVGDENESYDVVLSWDNLDNEFELLIDDGDIDFVNSNVADIDDGNNDRKRYATSYGTIIDYDTQERDFVKIKVPDEQIVGEVYVTFGGSSTVLETKIVASEDVMDEIQELERLGYEVIEVKNISSQDIIFDDNGEYVPAIVFDDEIDDIENKIIIGGPAVNKAAAQILGVDFPTYGVDLMVGANEGLIRYYDSFDSVLVYGYEYKDTSFVVDEFLKGENNGDEVVYITN